MDAFCAEREVLGYAIRVAVIPCGEQDLSVTVRGGVSPHVGSVSVARSGRLVQAWLGGGHRDDVISDRFAKELSGLTAGTVSVSCGIHYDKPSKEELSAIIEVCDSLLEDIKTEYLSM